MFFLVLVSSFLTWGSVKSPWRFVFCFSNVFWGFSQNFGLWFVVCCWLFVVCCLWFLVCCLLFAVCCLLLVVCVGAVGVFVSLCDCLFVCSTLLAWLCVGC